MRVFIAIDIDEKVRTALGDLQQQLANGGNVKKGAVKWVNPKNIHLTLKFLGEIKDEQAVEVCSIVENVAGLHKSFELDVESVGYFGSKAARVLWVGTGEGRNELHLLQKDVDKQLVLAGWPEEKREFTGHLTLCRIRNSAAGVKLAQVSEDYKDFKLGSIWADSVSVYQSQLKPTGPVYTVLGDYKLQ
jgi:2'-5' RNA ligase